MALTKEQLAARKNGLGGSDAAVILGLSRFKSPYDLYLEKTQDVADEDHERMRWGNLLEPVIAAEFTHRTKKQLVAAIDTVYHRDFKMLLANPDYYLRDEQAGLEIKCTSEWNSDDWGIEGSDQVPDYYLIQALHYAAVCGWQTIYLAVLIGGNRLRSFVVDATLPETRELIDEIVVREVAWWQEHIIGKKAPPRPNDVLNKAWEKTNGKVAVLDASIADKVRRLRDVKIDIKALEKEEEQLLSEVKEFVADNDEATFNGQRLLSWRFNKASVKPDMDKLKSEYPGVYSAILREVPGPRVLRLA